MNGEFSLVPCFRKQVSRSLSGFSVERINKTGVSFSASAISKSRRMVIGRIFANKRMTDKIMLANHVSNTIERCTQASEEIILVAQDTTHYNYDSHPAISGMGYMCGQSKGILQHNVLAMSEKGLPLGLIHQHHWSRGSEMPFDEKGRIESAKWIDGLSAVNTAFAKTDKTVLLMQDREADFFDLFKAERAPNVHILVRVFQNRLAKETISNEKGYVPEMPELCQTPGIVRKKIWHNKKEVEVRFLIKYAEIIIYSSKKDNHQQQTSPMNIISMTEVDTEGKIVKNGIYWLLLTSCKVNHAQDAFTIAGYYCSRWCIERFHYTLKSGALKVENMQFDDIHTLVNSIAFHSVIAWELLYLTHLQRTNYDEDVSLYYSKHEVSILQNFSKKKITTLGHFVLVLASLCGFEKSKTTPYPGVKKLAEAIERFYYIKIGANLQNSQTVAR